MKGKTFFNKMTGNLALKLIALAIAFLIWGGDPGDKHQ